MQEDKQTVKKDYVSRGFSLLSLLLAVIALVIAGLAVIWARENASELQTIRDAQTTTREADPPPAPANPNVTGGSDGVGTQQSNDEDIETPSPAGGIDTNGDLQR